LVVGTLLLVAAEGAAQVTTTAIYVASVAGLFGASALYHRGNWSPAVHGVLRRIDHFMIFVLIAGTATPVFVLAVGGDLGWVCLIVMWSLTLVASSIHQIWMAAPDWVAAGAFTGLGIVGAIALPRMWVNAGIAISVLIAVGGLLYIVGALSLNRRRPNLYPATFGYHEVFHACVCAAASCHYVAISLLILMGIGR
jgi:hemolysin III